MFRPSMRSSGSGLAPSASRSSSRRRSTAGASNSVFTPTATVSGANGGTLLSGGGTDNAGNTVTTPSEVRASRSSLFPTSSSVSTTQSSLNQGAGKGGQQPLLVRSSAQGATPTEVAISTLSQGSGRGKGLVPSPASGKKSGSTSSVLAVGAGPTMATPAANSFATHGTGAAQTHSSLVPSNPASNTVGVSGVSPTSTGVIATTPTGAATSSLEFVQQHGTTTGTSKSSTKKISASPIMSTRGPSRFFEDTSTDVDNNGEVEPKRSSGGFFSSARRSFLSFSGGDRSSRQAAQHQSKTREEGRTTQDEDYTIIFRADYKYNRNATAAGASSGDNASEQEGRTSGIETASRWQPAGPSDNSPSKAAMSTSTTFGLTAGSPVLNSFISSPQNLATEPQAVGANRVRRASRAAESAAATYNLPSKTSFTGAGSPSSPRSSRFFQVDLAKLGLEDPNGLSYMLQQNPDSEQSTAATTPPRVPTPKNFGVTSGLTGSTSTTNVDVATTGKVQTTNLLKAPFSGEISTSMPERSLTHRENDPTTSSGRLKTLYALRALAQALQPDDEEDETEPIKIDEDDEDYANVSGDEPHIRPYLGDFGTKPMLNFSSSIAARNASTTSSGLLYNTSSTGAPPSGPGGDALGSSSLYPAISAPNVNNCEDQGMKHLRDSSRSPSTSTTFEILHDHMRKTAFIGVSSENPPPSAPPQVTSAEEEGDRRPQLSSRGRLASAFQGGYLLGKGQQMISTTSEGSSVPPAIDTSRGTQAVETSGGFVSNQLVPAGAAAAAHDQQAASLEQAQRVSELERLVASLGEDNDRKNEQIGKLQKEVAAKTDEAATAKADAALCREKLVLSEARQEHERTVFEHEKAQLCESLEGEARAKDVYRMHVCELESRLETIAKVSGRDEPTTGSRSSALLSSLLGTSGSRTLLTQDFASGTGGEVGGSAAAASGGVTPTKFFSPRQHRSRSVTPIRVRPSGGAAAAPFPVPEEEVEQGDAEGILIRRLHIQKVDEAHDSTLSQTSMFAPTNAPRRTAMTSQGSTLTQPHQVVGGGLSILTIGAASTSSSPSAPPPGSPLTSSTGGRQMCNSPALNAAPSSSVVLETLQDSDTNRIFASTTAGAGSAASSSSSPAAARLVECSSTVGDSGSPAAAFLSFASVAASTSNAEQHQRGGANIFSTSAVGMNEDDDDEVPPDVDMEEL
ncbi:unnamed protein product [Amoebophrya sp. A25]|nr:unnamed protein product [Amoebophrya sp. A25]|eukprot:GSA25T00012163001.1